jgi:hypothetical protein
MHCNAVADSRFHALYWRQQQLHTTIMLPAEFLSLGAFITAPCSRSFPRSAGPVFLCILVEQPPPLQSQPEPRPRSSILLGVAAAITQQVRTPTPTLVKALTWSNVTNLFRATDSPSHCSRVLSLHRNEREVRRNSAQSLSICLSAYLTATTSSMAPLPTYPSRHLHSQP